jgi:tetratricopeptide (TPR) repeat protein
MIKRNDTDDRTWRITESAFPPAAQVLLLGFLSSLLYAVSLGANFLSLDDQDVLAWLQVSTWDLRGFFFPNMTHLYYRPIPAMSVFLDNQIWSGRAYGFHLTNVALHVANTLAVYFVASRLFDRRPLAFVAGALFAAHPIHTEAVNWIPGRTDLLASVFVLTASYGYIRYRQTGHLGLLVLAGVSYALGLLSKEVAMAFPFAMMAYEWMIGPRGIHRVRFEPIIRWGYLMAVTCGYLWLRAIALAKGDRGLQRSVQAVSEDGAAHVWNGLAALGFYAKKLLVPVPLNFSIWAIDEPLYVLFSVGVTTIAALLLLRRRLDGFLLGWVIVFVGPALLVAMSGAAWTPLAERYLYLPSVGLSICAASWFGDARIWERPRVILVLSGILIWFGVTTVHRGLQWTEPVSLWQDTVTKSPEFAPAYNEYGIALMRAKRYEEAKTQFEHAISLGYTDKPRQNLALIARYRDRDPKEVERLLRAEIERGIQTPRLYIGLAGAQLVLAGREPNRYEAYLREAIQNYQRAYELDPSNHLMHYRIGQLQLTLGHYDLARQHFEEAAEKGSPGDFFVEPSIRIVEKLRTGTYAASPRRSS